MARETPSGKRLSERQGGGGRLCLRLLVPCVAVTGTDVYKGRSAARGERETELPWRRASEKREIVGGCKLRMRHPPSSVAVEKRESC